MIHYIIAVHVMVCGSLEWRDEVCMEMSPSLAACLQRTQSLFSLQTPESS